MHVTFRFNEIKKNLVHSKQTQIYQKKQKKNKQNNFILTTAGSNSLPNLTRRYSPVLYLSIMKY